MKGDFFLVAELQQTAMRDFIGTKLARRVRGQRSAGDRVRRRACGYSKLTWKLRSRRLSPQINLSSSSTTEAGSSVLTPEDYRQLAERCALLAFECATPGVAHELRTLALDYLTRSISPMAMRSSSDNRL